MTGPAVGFWEQEDEHPNSTHERNLTS